MLSIFICDNLELSNASDFPLGAGKGNASEVTGLKIMSFLFKCSVIFSAMSNRVHIPLLTQ